MAGPSATLPPGMLSLAPEEPAMQAVMSASQSCTEGCASAIAVLQMSNTAPGLPTPRLGCSCGLGHQDAAAAAAVAAVTAVHVHPGSGGPIAVALRGPQALLIADCCSSAPPRRLECIAHEQGVAWRAAAWHPTLTKVQLHCAARRLPDCFCLACAQAAWALSVSPESDSTCCACLSLPGTSHLAMTCFLIISDGLTAGIEAVSIPTCWHANMHIPVCPSREAASLLAGASTSVTELRSHPG